MPSRRVSYALTIDGRRFECESLGDARQLLDRAKELAAEHAVTKLAMRQSQNVTKLAPLKVPQISVSSRELRKIAAQTQRAIKNIYEDALRDAEIRMLMELDSRKKDDEDAILLLM